MPSSGGALLSKSYFEVQSGRRPISKPHTLDCPQLRSAFQRSSSAKADILLFCFSFFVLFCSSFASSTYLQLNGRDVSFRFRAFSFPLITLAQDYSQRSLLQLTARHDELVALTQLEARVAAAEMDKCRQLVEEGRTREEAFKEQVRINALNSFVQRVNVSFVLSCIRKRTGRKPHALETFAALEEDSETERHSSVLGTSSSSRHSNHARRVSCSRQDWSPQPLTVVGKKLHHFGPRWSSAQRS